MLLARVPRSSQWVSNPDMDLVTALLVTNLRDAESVRIREAEVSSTDDDFTLLFRASSRDAFVPLRDQLFPRYRLRVLQAEAAPAPP